MNYGRAEAWYHAAAEHGDTNAIANLGVMSLLGQGAPADDLEAYTWIQSAVGLGHHSLGPVLAILERRIAGHAEALPDSIVPEVPALRPCTQPHCDYCRCNAA